MGEDGLCVAPCKGQADNGSTQPGCKAAAAFAAAVAGNSSTQRGALIFDVFAGHRVHSVL